MTITGRDAGSASFDTVESLKVISIHNLRAKPWSIGLFWIGYSNKWFPGGLGLLATSRIEILIEHLPVLINWGFPHGVSASSSQKKECCNILYILKWARVVLSEYHQKQNFLQYIKIIQILYLFDNVEE